MNFDGTKVGENKKRSNKNALQRVLDYHLEPKAPVFRCFQNQNALQTVNNCNAISQKKRYANLQ